MPFRLNRRILAPINTSLERRLWLRPLATGRILEDVWAVQTDNVNFFLIDTGDGLACFDAGYRRVLIREELQKIGVNRLDVSHVFLTHADIDHTRGLSVFPNAKVYLSHEEKQMITGRRSISSAVRSPRIRRTIHLLRDCDILKVGGYDIQAIETPGHTPGSMAYLVGGRYLFTGDTCKLADGRVYAGRHYTMDMLKQHESLRKLAKLEDVRYVFTAHAGYTDDFDIAFSDWRE